MGWWGWRRVAPRTGISRLRSACLELHKEDEGLGGLRSRDPGEKEMLRVTHSEPLSKSLPEDAHVCLDLRSALK